ncbi:MAG: acetate kinase [Kiritimatiellae bacterium]|nr:acetate kinase [Kiritimatiellia bacterium]
MPTNRYDKILVINSGSSSLKFMLFSMRAETMLAKGLVERIGAPSANLAYQRNGEAKTDEAISADNHGQALEMACAMLAHPERGVLKNLSEVNAIGHRVVHGGEQFRDSMSIDENVKKGINDCAALAPLHNPPNMGGIVACEKVFPGIPNVAVFDTAFHQTMEPHAFLYAIPYKYYEQYRIRKYGFHGTSHKFVMQATAAWLNKPVEELKLITCHLGNGSSIAAINGGRVVDTTMGMTPLPGLVMGSRCGDLDPAVVLFLARQGMTPDAIDDLLNKRSGLRGVGGLESGDMRDIVDAAAKGNTSAASALKMFGHRAALYIGGYFTLLGGADAIVLTGGIGENSAAARAAIVERLTALGCHLDPARNAETRGRAGAITQDTSRVPVLIMPTNEELMIARETFRVLTSPAQPVTNATA